MWAMIGQFRGLYFTVQATKLKSFFELKSFPFHLSPKLL